MGLFDWRKKNKAAAAAKRVPAREELIQQEQALPHQQSPYQQQQQQSPYQQQQQQQQSPYQQQESTYQQQQQSPYRVQLPGQDYYQSPENPDYPSTPSGVQNGSYPPNGGYHQDYPLTPVGGVGFHEPFADPGYQQDRLSEVGSSISSRRGPRNTQPPRRVVSLAALSSSSSTSPSSTSPSSTAPSSSSSRAKSNRDLNLNLKLGRAGITIDNGDGRTYVVDGAFKVIEEDGRRINVTQNGSSNRRHRSFRSEEEDSDDCSCVDDRVVPACRAASHCGGHKSNHANQIVETRTYACYDPNCRGGSSVQHCHCGQSQLSSSSQGDCNHCNCNNRQQQHGNQHQPPVEIVRQHQISPNGTTTTTIKTVSYPGRFEYAGSGANNFNNINYPYDAAAGGGGGGGAGGAMGGGAAGGAGAMGPAGKVAGKPVAPKVPAAECPTSAPGSTSSPAPTTSPNTEPKPNKAAVSPNKASGAGWSAGWSSGSAKGSGAAPAKGGKRL